MYSLLPLVKCSAINSSDPTTMRYSVIKYLSETYTLQEEQTIDGQVSNEGERVVKEEYLIIMKSKTNWHWKHHGTNQSVILSTHAIVHTCLDVSVFNNVADISNSIRNKK